MKECHVDPVKGHCRPLSASYLNPIAYFVYGAIFIYQTFCIVAIQMHQYPFLKLLYPCGLFKVDSGNIVREGGEISYKHLLSVTVLNV